MFAKSKNNDHPKHAHHAGLVTTIAAGTTLHGDIESDTDMRIDGNIIGNVVCRAKIVLGESGIVQGDLQSVNADIFGTVNGNVTAKELLCLKSKSTINGNLATGRLQIEPNAVFNGKCTMTTGKTAEITPEIPPVLVIQDN